ncbi:MAG: Gfo/Idh/MocA family oxidoreductase [Saprospiraceae bacterium]|nr:Gfo/Idh/MocA family oxidoreductase [Saprospiraceae bacterium]MBK8282528.1 Gfo/Idh/MocA family oxidoreductase [Saprospiraceae bacterium]MBK8778777.1 Gfo/Idh/MocA family oxidoreductase [Saprospiraceae bacterium]
MKTNLSNKSRRDFIKKSAQTAFAISLPSIVPSSVFGKNAPSNRINVGAIGTGRISRTHDMPGVWQYDYARIMAVCDLDNNRAQDAKKLVNGVYAKKTGKDYDGVTVYNNYEELLQNKDVDAVLISTPDHWHARIAIDAAKTGKHIYMQKPASLTIVEGRKMSNAVQASNIKFQVGSQQRSSTQFRYAAELVRNGRIGQLQKVYVGLPGDPSGDEEPAMPVPAGFDYNKWLGSTPEVYYTEKRVHPQVGYDRPGWLRCEQFGAGMITGWGAHHIDSAHWGMGTERTGPIEIWGHADFPKSGLWNVHGIFRTEAKYANGVHMIVSNELPNGIKFEGTDGWIWVTRGNYRATDSDPVNSDGTKPLDASDPKLLTSVIGPNEFHFEVSAEHHGNWLEAIRDNKNPIAPVEEAHRSCTACLLHHIAMKLDRKIYWDPAKENFIYDAEARAMLSRAQREPFGV